MFDKESQFTTEEAEEDWTRWILGLYQVAHRPGILAFWVSGAGGRKMESLSDEQIQKQCSSFLRKRLQKKFPNMTDPIGVKVCERPDC